MKTLTTRLDETTHFKFKNKCKFYDYTLDEVLGILIHNFNEGKYDEDLNIPSSDNGTLNGQ